MGLGKIEKLGFWKILLMDISKEKGVFFIKSVHG